MNPSPTASPPSAAPQRSESKQPVLQVFVMPVGLPRCRMLVTCSMTLESRVEELARTEALDQSDPLFDEPLELWEEASGKHAKGASSKSAQLPLTFAVVRLGEDGDELDTLAVAQILSDELRGYGLFNPREGAAVALPLRRTLNGQHLPSALLHCFIHSGYLKRPPREPTLSSASSGLSTGSYLPLRPPSGVKSRQKCHAISLEHSCRLIPSSEVISATAPPSLHPCPVPMPYWLPPAPPTHLHTCPRTCSP